MNNFFKVLALLAFVISVLNSIVIVSIPKEHKHEINRPSLDEIYERTRPKPLASS